MEWFNIKEKSAGEKRLLISWYLYKLLGVNIVLVIAFFVAIVTFFTNKDLRNYSKKYFEVLPPEHLLLPHNRALLRVLLKLSSVKLFS